MRRSGSSEAAPRALPQDFAVALTSTVIDGGVAVKLLLAVGLWLAGWGAARLVGGGAAGRGPGRAVCGGDARDLESRMSRSVFCRGTGA